MHQRAYIKLWQLFTALLILVFSFSAQADDKFCQRPDVKKFVGEVAAKYDFTPAYLNNIMSQIKLNPEVIAKMKHPYEAKPWGFYRNFFITPDRIQDAVSFYKKYHHVLALEENYYGVPANIIVAIIGVETRYGEKMGDYRILDTLATLAFNYSPRSAYFKQELANFLVLTRQYKLNPLTLDGSRSGAMGLCQFMPSSYLRYGVNYNNSYKSPPNLFTNAADAIFSAGNFLMQNGWDRNEPIATPVKVIGNGYKKIAKWQGKNSIVHPAIPLYEFEKYNIIPAGVFNPTDLAYLLHLEGNTGEEFWLGFKNFYAITRYNNSNLYAMAIYQFAQEIEGTYQEQNSFTNK
jgi:membrane-bound lytic murein transglycosylase B